MKKKERVKLFKHQLLITAISAFAVVFTMISGSYAIFSSTSKADEYNVLTVGELEISYVDTGDGYGDILSLNGAYPINDSDGVKESPYRFNITNTGTIAADFKIKILYDESIIEEDGCNDNLLDQKYIKYQFDNEEPVLLSSKKDSDYVVYESKNLLPNSSEIHEVRIWIDDNATNEILGKHFHGKVVIESIQSGIDEELKIEYAIGQKITLKDGSSWHVLENSNENSATVTLLSDYNLTSEGSYDISCTDYVCSTMAFDNANARQTTINSYCDMIESGCNIYQKNSNTVTQDSTIKVWLDTVYLSRLEESLTSSGGTTDGLVISIPTMEQLATVDGIKFNQSQVTFNSRWLTTTSYWTKTASTLNSSYVWRIVGESNNSDIQNASSNNLTGVRPVIVTSKLNIQSQ